MERLLMAQDLLVDASGDYAGGFNSRIHGYSNDEVNGYPAYPSPSRQAGWYRAEDLIQKGKVFYVHRFKHKAFDRMCDGYAFPYGGFWVCNTCGRKNVDEPWWAVKVYMDGNAWCCVGLGFQDLQTADNYAFGDTRDEALANYERLMLYDNPTRESGGSK